MAEALMLEMDGDSDGSINEEELVSFFLLSVKKISKCSYQLWHISFMSDGNRSHLISIEVKRWIGYLL